MADIVVSGLSDAQAQNIVARANNRVDFCEGATDTCALRIPVANVTVSLARPGSLSDGGGAGDGVRLQELSPAEIARNFGDGFHFGFLAMLVPVLVIAVGGILVDFIRQRIRRGGD